MNIAPVTVVTCVYGDHHDRFIPAWRAAVADLDPKPIDLVIAADLPYHVKSAFVDVSRCDWRHPQAYYLNRAIRAARTEWMWIVDIDDLAVPNALEGIEDVTADVWLAGYISSDGDAYVPPRLTRSEYLACEGNPYPAGSMIRREAFIRAGGFPDVAFQDWALWRRMAELGMDFEVAGRVQYRYMRHDHTRTELELTAETRRQHLAEMRSALAVA